MTKQEYLSNTNILLMSEAAKGDKNANWKGGKIKRICLNCKKDFEVFNRTIKRGHGKFCSLLCKYNYMRGEKSPVWKGGNIENICEHCGLIYKARRIPYIKGESKFCSLDCLHKHKIRENHSQWKGGVTSFMISIRTSRQYELWRKSVFIRDNYTCQKCGRKSGNGKTIILEAHHKKHFAKIVEENNLITMSDAIKCNELWNVSNGITLCIKCHRGGKHIVI